jgi:hypothetical protein
MSEPQDWLAGTGANFLLAARQTAHFAFVLPYIKLYAPVIPDDK